MLNTVESGKYGQGLMPESLKTGIALTDAWRAAGIISEGSLSEIESRLKAAVLEFNIQPPNPDFTTQVFAEIWRVRGKKVDTDFSVEPCPYTVEELITLESEGRRVGYLPETLATQEGRPALLQMFPRIWTVPDRPYNRFLNVINQMNPFGWFDYEASIDAPYRGTTEPELIQTVIAEGGKINLLNLNQYTVAGQDSCLLTGRLLDDSAGSWVRIASHHSDDSSPILAGYMGRTGFLLVGVAEKPDQRLPSYGGRSFGQKIERFI